jgi:hypothetical protein
VSITIWIGFIMVLYMMPFRPSRNAKTGDVVWLIYENKG